MADWNAFGIGNMNKARQLMSNYNIVPPVNQQVMRWRISPGVVVFKYNSKDRNVNLKILVDNLQTPRP